VKRGWIALILIALTVIGVIYNAGKMYSITGELSKSLNACTQALREDNWDDARQYYEDSFRIFKEHEIYLGAVSRHSELDEIFTSISKLAGHIALQNKEDALPELLELRERVDHLAHLEELTIDNIF